MTKPFEHSRTEFYLTSPAPCPYLEGRQERKVFSLLSGPSAPMVNANLTQRGFRRSQNIIYMPACDHCNACKPVRIVVKDFALKPSWKRIIRRNKTTLRKVKGATASAEQFSVLRAYLDDRHSEGGMAEMTVLDYTSMVEQTAVDTIVIEYRSNVGTPDERLIACSLTDRLPDGLSMVYSFFDPDVRAQSLGSHMILDHVLFARELGLDYVYLGYWIDGSAKMQYKSRFQPLEQWTASGWAPLHDKSL